MSGQPSFQGIPDNIVLGIKALRVKKDELETENAQLRDEIERLKREVETFKHLNSLEAFENHSRETLMNDKRKMGAQSTSTTIVGRSGGGWKEAQTDDK